MKSKKIIAIFYIMFIFYLLSLYLISNFSFANYILSIIALLLLYTSYSLGYKFKIPIKLKESENERLIKNYTVKTKMVLFIVLLCSSFLYVRYYTGKSPVGVITSYKNNISVYNQYQQYFSAHNISAFTISKVPYILLGFFIKVMAFRAVIENSLTSKKVSALDVFFSTLMVLPYIYIGLGRGTSFEIFEILMLLIYVLFRRINKINVKLIMKMFIVSFFGMMLFIRLVDARNFVYNFGKLSSGIYYDNEKLLTNLFPNFTKILYRLYGYFGFGFFYTSNYLEHIIINERLGFVKILFPRHAEVFYHSSVNALVDRFVDVGVRWRPDFVKYLDGFGLIIFILIIALLGWFSYSLERAKPSVTSEILNFFIVLQMFSMLIGNFVVTSSSSKLMIILLVIRLFRLAILM